MLSCGSHPCSPRGGEGKADPLLFGDEGGGTRAAGGIQNEITGIGSHKDATFDHPGSRLDNEKFGFSP